MKLLFLSLVFPLIAEAFEQHHYELDGRKFVVVLPDSFDPQKTYSTMFFLHGARFLYDSFSYETEDALADQFDLVLVRPIAKKVGLRIRWENGLSSDSATDVEFIQNVRSQTQTLYPNLAAAYYLMGESSGAMMVARMAKERPQLFEAYGILSGSLEFWDKSPLTPVRLIQIHGTGDILVKYKKGKGLIAKHGARESFFEWMEAGGARKRAKAVLGPKLTVEVYENDMHHEFSKFVSIKGHGHMISPALKAKLYPLMMEFFHKVN